MASSDTSGVDQRYGGESKVFARESTGLVREVGPVSAAIYNLSYSSAPLGLALLFWLGPAFYPGGNMYLATLLTLLLTLPTAFVFAMFVSAIPRSGGDYTWISRSISPTLGFMSNFSYMFWALFIVGVYAILVPSWGLGPALRMIAAGWDMPRALDLANWLNGEWGTFVVGVALILISAAMLIFSRGLRVYIKIQNWLFAFWAIMLLVVAPIILFAVSKGTFQSHFDSYVRDLHGPNNAHSVVLGTDGTDLAGFSLAQTILMVTIPFYPLGFIYQSVYFAGEIKRGKRGMLLAIPGAQVLTALIFIVVIAAFSTGVGNSFLAGLGLADPSKYGLDFTPLYPELAGIASGSALLGVIMLVANALFLAIFVPITIIMVSRSLFAWSFDRLAPEKISGVSPRTHSPVNAVLLIAGLAIISVAVVAFNPSLGALVVLLGQSLTFISVGIAAVVFPYRKREVFEASPFNRRINGIPLMSIVGAISVVTATCVSVILATDVNSGTSWAANRDRVWLVIGVFFGAFFVYQAARYIQKARGIDIDLAYKEIPPE